jgi:pimeloyl-[acyl-carrier protein] methyl ester esterase
MRSATWLRIGTDMEAEATQVHVESAGFGSPLVLLHGFAMHGGLFAPLVPALARRHRVHVVDIPGHGHSPSIEPFELPTVTEAIDRAIAPNDAPLDVLGWSLGGEIALQWALAHPHRVRRLVLVATTPSFVERPDWPHAMTGATLARFGDELRVSYRLTLQRFLALQVHGSEEGRATLAELRQRLFERGEPSRGVLAGTLALLQRVDLRPALARIDACALVIGGERDALVPIEATRALAAALPRARHVTIAAAAHAPVLSHRAAFLDIVLTFLDG